MAIKHDLPAEQAISEVVTTKKTKVEVDGGGISSTLILQENVATPDNRSKSPDNDKAIVTQSTQQALKLDHEKVATEASDMAPAERSFTFDLSLAKWDITGAEYRFVP